jgi:hypothetical protein
MTMQDNGRSPNERPSLISSTPISGTVNCTAQDRKETVEGLYRSSKNCGKSSMLRKKTAHYERGNAKRLPGGMKSPKPKSHGAEKPEGNAETMLYRNIWQKTKQLKRIHEVCRECRNAFRESPKHLNNKTKIR